MKKLILFVPFLCVAGVLRCVGDTSTTTDAGMDATTDVASDVAPDSHPADAGTEAEAGPQPCTFPEGGVSGTLDQGFAAQFYPNIFNSTALAFDSAGKIYVVGFDGQSGGISPPPSPLCGLNTGIRGVSDAYMIKTANNGTLDTTFGSTDGGTAGKFCLAVPGYQTADFQAVAADPDGTLIAVGVVRDVCGTPYCTGTTSGVKALVVRITAAGALDTTFNSSGSVPGVLLLDAVSGDRSAAFAVALDTGFPQAKIVVAGSNNHYFSTPLTAGWVMRLNHDGTPDTFNFAAAPLVDTTANGYFGVAVVNHDIYVSGANGQTPQSAIVRKVLGSGSGHGTFDPAFGGGNAVTVPLGTGNAGAGEGVVPLADGGSVAVAGFASATTLQTSVTAIGADGGVNTAFGTGGSTALSVGGQPAYYANGYQFGLLTTDCEKRLLVSTNVLVDAGKNDAGEDFEEATIARLLTTGSPDPTFGTSGFGFVGAGFNSSAASAAVEDPVTGGIVVILRSRGGYQDARLGLVRLYR